MWVINCMTTKGYVNDFYKQFEKLNNNLEKAQLIQYLECH